MSAPPPRIYTCPTCNTETTARYCPEDGSLTMAPLRLAEGSAELAVGRMVGQRYRILSQLGTGGFGTVYLAVHVGTHQSVALKTLHTPDGPDGAKLLRRFFQEARITAQLVSPCTVRLYDVGQMTDGRPYMVMEHLHGPTLRQWLAQRASERRPVLEHEAVAIAYGVVQSLQEAHDHGLVHRDLTPANIILSHPEGEPPADVCDSVAKVLDFGIARVAHSSLTESGSTLGTPAYMSPEQCAGQAVDGRSDLYALGVILFECVSGRRPFDGDHPLVIMNQHATRPPPDLATCSQTPLSHDFVTCVLRALAKAPGDRFASAEDMGRALTEGLDERSARPERTEPAATPAVLANGGTSATEPDFRALTAVSDLVAGTVNAQDEPVTPRARVQVDAVSERDRTAADVTPIVSLSSSPPRFSTAARAAGETKPAGTEPADKRVMWRRWTVAIVVTLGVATVVAIGVATRVEPSLLKSGASRLQHTTRQPASPRRVRLHGASSPKSSAASTIQAGASGTQTTASLERLAGVQPSHAATMASDAAAAQVPSPIVKDKLQDHRQTSSSPSSPSPPSPPSQPAKLNPKRPSTPPKRHPRHVRLPIAQPKEAGRRETPERHFLD